MINDSEQNTPQMVVVVYRPKAGLASELLGCVRDHLPVLRAQGLATDRPPVALRAKDGSIVELFEWCSADAIEKSHTNPAVMALWERFGKCCEYVPLANLPESHRLFSPFELVAL